MVQAQIRKRLLARCSQPLLRVVPLNQTVAILQVDADGKSVLFQEATINQTPFSTDCERFGCPLLSLKVRNVSAYLTTGFRGQLYLSKDRIFKDKIQTGVATRSSTTKPKAVWKWCPR